MSLVHANALCTLLTHILQKDLHSDSNDTADSVALYYITVSLGM